MRIEARPIFNIQLYLDTLHNVELSNRGYYQIRLSAKTNPDLTLEFRTEKGSDCGVSLPHALLPSTIIDGVAVSRTIELVFADESLAIDDVFHISVQANARSNCVTVSRLQLNVELWYADRHRPPNHEHFSYVSRRVLELDLHTDSAQNAYRPLFFEFFAFSAVTIGVYSSLVSMLVRRKKSPPDPPPSPKVHEFHRSMCRALLRSIRSLEVFITTNAKLVHTSVSLKVTDPQEEEDSLAAQLVTSTDPYSKIEDDAVRLSARLNTVHTQFLQLFSRCNALMARMSKDFDDWRWKQLGEAFFFLERPNSDLLNDSQNPYASMFTSVRNSGYLASLGRHQIFCPSTDSPPDAVPIIFEERFLPPGSPSGSMSSRSDHNRNVTTSQVAAMSERSQRSPAKTAREKLASKEGKRKLLVRRNTLNGTKSISEPSSVNNSGEQTATGTPLSGGIISAETSPRDNNDLTSPNALNPAISTAFPFSEANPESIARLVEFVKERQLLKTRLAVENNYDGCLYSEMASSSLRPASLIDVRRSSDRSNLFSGTPHLIVFVHGLEGGSYDLIPYRNFLRANLPKSSMLFLMSESNVYDTWSDVERMGENLLEEVAEYVANMARPPTRISFIAHSLGGIIVRAAVGRADADWLRAKTHTLLTLNSPHLGLPYGARVSTWGVALVQWWKKSRSIEQLSLRDGMNFSDSLLYSLSKNGAFSNFKNVLVVGVPGDVYVPLHSALLEPCKASQKDPSALGTAYREMLANIRDDILSSPKNTILVRYTVFHNLTAIGRTHRLTGRAAHTAAVDDDLFIEKLLSVSVLRYFV